MTTTSAPHRRTVLERLRIATLPLGLATLAVLSLAYPLIAPVVAIGGGVVSHVTVRRTGSRLARLALGICALVVALSLVVDVGLLAVKSVEIGHPTAGTSSN